jgi:hypothetical protein
MGRPPRPRRWLPVPHLLRAGSVLERRRKNHDRAIDDIGKAGKNVKTPGDPIYNLRCLALVRQQCYVVCPDKFKPDIGTRYDGTTNPIEFLQLYVVAVQAACGD